MKKLKQNKKGFSLVELIVAVAVLAIIVVPLLRTFVIAQNMETKSISYTQATTAADNILNTIQAEPISYFMNFNDTTDAELGTKQELSALISGGEDDISFSNVIDSSRISGMITTLTDDNEFISVLQGVKSGSATYDAVVTFDRGDQTNSLSDGIKEINDHTVVQYDRMDAVFSQPNLAETNPDERADTELKAEAASRFGKSIDAEPDSKERTIQINAYEDSTDDDGNVETIGCYVIYTYYYTYNNVTEGNVKRNRTINTSYTYAIFPGSYAYDGDNVSIYIMYYPWEDSTDNIEIYNNADGLNWLNLSVYLYLQNPDSITSNNSYHPVIDYFMPESYDNSDGTEESFVYTNLNRSTYPLFEFYMTTGYGYSNPSYDYADKMVKSIDNKLMYNITIEIYKHGAVTVNDRDHTVSIDGDCVYKTVGSKSQD